MKKPRNPNFKYTKHKQIDIAYVFGTVKHREQTGYIFLNFNSNILEKENLDLKVTITANTPYTVLGNIQLFQLDEDNKHTQIHIEPSLDINERSETAVAQIQLLPNTRYRVMVEHNISDKRVHVHSEMR
jgi:hypothetical protein